MSEDAGKAYWYAVLKLVAVILVIWFLVSYVFGILLVDQLNAFLENHEDLRSIRGEEFVRLLEAVPAAVRNHGDGGLDIMTNTNQDRPLRQGKAPIPGLDMC